MLHRAGLEARGEAWGRTTPPHRVVTTYLLDCLPRTEVDHVSSTCRRPKLFLINIGVFDRRPTNRPLDLLAVYQF